MLLITLRMAIVLSVMVPLSDPARTDVQSPMGRADQPTIATPRERQGTHHPPDRRQRDTENIREKAFRSLFVDPYVKAPTHSVYFLAIDDGKDPDVAFFRRFRNSKWRLRPTSMSIQAVNPAGDDFEYKDHKTGEVGCVFTLSAVKWVSKNEAVIPWGVSSLPRRGISGAFSVKREHGIWKVKPYKLDSWARN